MTGKTTVKSGGHAYSGAYHGIKSGVDYRRTVGSFGHRAVMSPAGLPMPVDKDAPLFAALGCRHEQLQNADSAAERVWL